MGDALGFKKHNRELPKYESVESRILHYNEFNEKVGEDFVNTQSARCMDCGVPFCHSGCPLGNKIPDFNDAVYKNNWQEAYEILKSTNNFPEFTGRICPAPCESSCVLGINSDPVSIEFVEKSIVEKAFSEGWVKPNKLIVRSGKKVVIVGSGPAGLAAADQLNKAGHQVEVHEKNTRVGGLLRYGIPDFKLEKKIIDRRVKILEEEGIRFICNSEVGVNVDLQALKSGSDALLLCGGSSIPRDLNIEGREFKGIHFAMEFLEKNNKRVAGDNIDFSAFNIKGKNVVVIGGGDTGSDCIGTSKRLGAKSITQIELLSKPNTQRTVNNPWPQWPMILRTSSSHSEGCDREWSILTKKFISEDNTNLSGIEVVNVEWGLNSEGEMKMIEQLDSTRIIPCDYVFLAIGFLNPKYKGMLESLDVKLDNRNNVNCFNYQTSVPGVFAAGDMRRGQSLVVWAISEGREAAIAVDRFLMGDKSQMTSNFASVMEV